MKEPEILTPQEVAARMRLSVRTVQRLIERGELPGVQAGKTYRILATDLERYLSGNGRVLDELLETVRSAADDQFGREDEAWFLESAFRLDTGLRISLRIGRGDFHAARIGRTEIQDYAQTAQELHVRLRTWVKSLPVGAGNVAAGP